MTIKKILLTILLLMPTYLLAASEEEKKLVALFDLIWDFAMTSDPVSATYIGYPGQNALWQDVSLDAVAERDRTWQQLLKDLYAIKVDALDEEPQ